MARARQRPGGPASAWTPESKNKTSKVVASERRGAPLGAVPLRRGASHGDEHGAFRTLT